MNVTLLIISIIAFTICSAFLSGSETALFSLSSMKIHAYRDSRQKLKRLIARLVLKPRDLLVTILMSNILANIMVQNLSSNLFQGSHRWTLKVGVPLMLTLVFGEIIPKSIAINNNVRFSKVAAPVVAFLQRSFGPLRYFLIAITSYISKTIFFFLRKEKPISKAELQYILRTSQQDGVLKTDEAQLMHGYLNLQEATVKELMRPREDIVYYDLQNPLEELKSLFQEKHYSRIPVTKGGLDNLKGIISARQFLLNRHNIESNEDLLPYLYKPFFVPETTTAPQLFRSYEVKNETMAIAVNEYGIIEGVITREDLFNEVVGRVAPDQKQYKHYTPAGRDVIIASGKMEINELEEFFNINIKSPTNMVTIGGWLTEKLGDIPQAGKSLKSHGLLFQILAADPNRVRRVYVRKLYPATTSRK
ncbi:MAG: hemolysin family protein [Chlamydiota bacterium]